MAEFYHWPRNACYLVTFVIAICVLSQTLAVLASVYRRPRSRARILETILELIILCHVFICSLEHGQTMTGYDLGLYTPVGFEGWRIGAFVAVSLSSILAAAETRKLRTLVLLVFAGLTLPAAEQTGMLFPYLFAAAILFFMIRAILTGWSRYREITTNISALSVKNAMDSLHTGVMFMESNGFIVLCNERMQELMTAITGRVQRNGMRFFDLLRASGDSRVTRFEGHSVCHLEDGSAWMFKRSELRLKRKSYLQLTATDITERWRLTEQLKKQNEALALRKKELDDAIAGLHILSHERETQKAKLRAHDILGKRLTLLLSVIRNEQAPDNDLLRALSGGLIDELKSGAAAPQDELNSLVNIFGTLGVEIEIVGELPSDDDKARLFVEIAREAVTNAVKHGFATEVAIRTYCDHMVISDNGFSCGEVKEGGGLNGMRRRLVRFGGALNVQTQPRFTLTVKL